EPAGPEMDSHLVASVPASSQDHAALLEFNSARCAKLPRHDFDGKGQIFYVLAGSVPFGVRTEGKTSTVLCESAARIVILSTVVAETGVLMTAALTWKPEAESEKVAAMKKET
ncbi:hypothetical protein diail_8869, partial [Diaporthe ilicicola]